MSRGFPSMTALLGLVAVAGFQNRDKLAEMLGGGRSSQGQDNQQGSLGGLLGSLGGASGGGLLSGGLGELVERFKQNGQGETAESWVGHRPNREVSPQELERAIGPDVLADLSQRTGLPKDELLSRLSRDLPLAVDNSTPEGRLPTEDDLSRS